MFMLFNHNLLKLERSAFLKYFSILTPFETIFTENI